VKAKALIEIRKQRMRAAPKTVYEKSDKKQWQKWYMKVNEKGGRNPFGRLRI